MTERNTIFATGAVPPDRAILVQIHPDVSAHMVCHVWLDRSAPLLDVGQAWVDVAYGEGDANMMLPFLTFDDHVLEWSKTADDYGIAHCHRLYILNASSD